MTQSTSIRRLSADEAVTLQVLAASWPVGTRVRHGHSMWLGRIVPGDSAGCPGTHIGTAPAHCLLPAAAGHDDGAVCVQWDHPDTQPGAENRDPVAVWPDPQIGPAWMRPGVLRLVRVRERSVR